MPSVKRSRSPLAPWAPKCPSPSAIAEFNHNIPDFSQSFRTHLDAARDLLFNGNYPKATPVLDELSRNLHAHLQEVHFFVVKMREGKHGRSEMAEVVRYEGELDGMEVMVGKLKGFHTAGSVKGVPRKELVEKYKECFSEDQRDYYFRRRLSDSHFDGSRNVVNGAGAEK